MLVVSADGSYSRWMIGDSLGRMSRESDVVSLVGCQTGLEEMTEQRNDGLRGWGRGWKREVSSRRRCK